MQSQTLSGMVRNVVVVGGGFGGLACVRRLARVLGPQGFTVTLVSDKSTSTYYPGLFRILRGVPETALEIDLSEVVDSFPVVRLVIGRVVVVDVAAKQITLESGETITADYLVLAPGSQPAYFNIPEMDSTSFVMKNGYAAAELKKHVERLFVMHATAPVQEQTIAFRFVVVGGGASGVEMSIELKGLVTNLIKQYNLPESLATVDLIESKDRVLANMPEKASSLVYRRLQKHGIYVMCNRTVTRGQSWSVELSDARMGARTLVWTAGIEPNSLIRNITGLKYGARGRVVVDEYLQALGYDCVYVIGDCADTPRSGLAQTAIRQGDFVGQDIVSRVMSNRRISYTEGMIAYVVPVGSRWGIAVFGSYVFSGLLPAILRRLIDFRYYWSVLGFVRALKLL